jgi:hypothetical protein
MTGPRKGSARIGLSVETTSLGELCSVNKEHSIPELREQHRGWRTGASRTDDDHAT